MGTGQASRRRKSIATYKELKKKGICTNCGKNKARPNRVTCQKCLEVIRK